MLRYLSIPNISPMVLTSRLRYALYGSLLSASLISLSVSAGAADGVFGEYFNNIIKDSTNCGINTTITGFTSTAGTSFGTQRCTTFQNIVKSVLGSSTAPDGQAIIWFDATTGNPKYGSVNWQNSGGNISYTGGNVGIGTTTPGAKFEVAWWGLSMKWGEIIIQRPVTTGGWARWLHYTPDNSYDSTNAGLAGIGLLGGGTTESSIYLTFGTAPWSSSRGIQILSNGNVGIWTTTPTAKLQVNGNIQAAGSPVPANWYNLQAGSIWASTVYGYNGICTGNWSWDCTSNGGVVLHPAGSIGIWWKSESTTWGMSIHKDDWAIVTRKADGGDNAEPQNSRGSIYVNDIYIRSIGKWASQLAAGSVPQGTLCGVAVRYWSGPISPYVSCQWQSIITSTTIPSWYTQPAWYDENGNYYPESWIDTSTTQQAWNCPSWYSPQQTTHANWGGQSGDDTWSCVKN